MLALLARFDQYLVELSFAKKAAELYADDLALDTHASGDWREWSISRVNLAKKQLALRWTNEGLYPRSYLIDGLEGPGTRYGLEAYEYFEKHKKLPDWRDDELIQGNLFPEKPSPFPREKDVPTFYGDHSTIRSQMVRVRCPWTLRIAWDLSKTRTFLWSHKKCAEPLAAVLEGVWAVYGAKELRALKLDIFSGDYNDRPKRGSTRQLSMHAYCIAWDFGDQWNQLRWGSDKALYARPEYEDWWRLWEEQGFVSLGRERDYDWMHVQAARLN